MAIKYAKCQYWIASTLCKYWESEWVGTSEGTRVQCGCTFEGDSSPTYFPFCNNIGTAYDCSKFSPGEKQDICVLPDLTISSGNLKKASVWAWIEELEKSFYLNTTLINEYVLPSDASCEGVNSGKGANVECLGYNPNRMGFGKILPTSVSTKKQPNLAFRLPAPYKLLNSRTHVSTCYWWKKNQSEFYLEELPADLHPPRDISLVGNSLGTVPKILLKNIDKPVYQHSCRRSDTSEFINESFTNYPCNGSNTECSHYTGKCWKYVSNTKIRPGDYISAEQVLELRYYVKENTWTEENYNNLFFDKLCLYAWLGEKEQVYTPLGEYTTYYVNNTSLDTDFNFFNISCKKELLVAGTDVKASKSSGSPEDTVSFPTLIFKNDILLNSPIIKNIFLSIEEKLVIETNKAYSSSTLIFGDLHTYTYDTICINISKLDSTPKILEKLLEVADVNILYTELIGVVTDTYDLNSNSSFLDLNLEIDSLVSNLRKNNSSSISENTLSADDKCFMFNVDTLYNNNNLLVLSKYYSYELNSLYWSFASINFYKVLVAGFLRQLSYSIEKPAQPEGRADIVSTLHDYRRSISGMDTEVKVEFIPFMHKYLQFYTKIENVYNDFEQPSLKDPTATSKSYAECTYERDFLLTSEDFYVISSNCMLLLVLPEDAEGKITEAYSSVKIQQEEDNDIYIEVVIDKDTKRYCNLEVYKYGMSNGLSSNQLILKPKNMSEAFSICEDNSTIYIKNISFKVKYSFGLEPPDLPGWKKIITQPSLPEGGVSLQILDNFFTIKDFDTSIVATTAITGIDGRVVSLVRIKLFITIKQPLVPNVEISYKWRTQVESLHNEPWCHCCGPHEEISDGKSSLAHTPKCGDHNGRYMWFPYTACEDYSIYYYVSNQTYGEITEVREMYLPPKDEDGNVKKDEYGRDLPPKNGSWNLRMEGPDENMYTTGDYCNFLLARCSCLLHTGNISKVADAEYTFSGVARYRGDVNIDTINGTAYSKGTSPTYGNTLRPQLKSYRTTDCVRYYYTTQWPPTEYYESLMWMPHNMSYSDIDYNNNIDNIYYNYCSLASGTPIQGLGTVLYNVLDGESVGEYIAEERYTFKEIYTNIFNFVPIAYPITEMPVNAEARPVPQFNTINGKTIQWAWREIYKELTREFTLDDFYTALKFVDVSSPKYRYATMNIEHSIVCAEGEYDLIFKPPMLDSGGVYEEGKFPTLQLGNGPPREFTWQGALDPNAGLAEEGECKYSELTSTPWEDIGLFDVTWDKTIEEATVNGKKIVVAGGTVGGPSTITYYNRGINIDSLNLLGTLNLPIEFLRMSGFSYTGVPVEILPSVSTVMHIDTSGYKVAITKGELKFKYGIQQNKEGAIVYCVPSIIIDSIIVTSVKIPNFLGVREETVSFSLDLNVDKLVDRSESFSLTLYYEKYKAKEVSKLLTTKDFKYRASLVEKEPVVLFDTIIIQAVENIFVHERKYKVSFFKHDFIPPHGTVLNSSQPVLQPREDLMELDTVWQRDDGESVSRLPNSSGKHKFIHKTRSRLVHEVVQDKKIIYKDIYDLEKEQNLIYNKPYKECENVDSFTSILYPDMEYFLDLHSLRIVSSLTSQGLSENKAVYPLGTLIKYPVMAGKGFKLLPSEPYEGVYCRPYGNREGCGTVGGHYMYSRYNMFTGESLTRYFDASIIYSTGTLLYMQRLIIAWWLVDKIAESFENVVVPKGKVFEEGEVANLSVPGFYCLPGVYSKDLGPSTTYPVTFTTWRGMSIGWTRLGSAEYDF